MNFPLTSKGDQEHAPTMADMLGGFMAYDQAHKTCPDASNLTSSSLTTQNISSTNSSSSSARTEYGQQKTPSPAAKYTAPRSK